LIKRNEINKRRLKKTLKIILYIIFILFILVLILFLFIILFFSIRHFWTEFGAKMPSLWLLDSCFWKYMDLVQKFYGNVYHKGAFFDDYNFVNLVFNLYRSHFWNDWFKTELEKWKLNLFEQVWQSNKIFIEKSFLFAYFLKTLGEYWVEDIPVEDRIDQVVDYIRSMNFYLNETPFYFARYKTSFNSLKDRIINMKVWRLQKILDFRSAFLKFKINTLDNSNTIYDNWSMHLYLLKLILNFNLMNILYLFILFCVLYFVIKKVWNIINKQSKLYNDFVLFLRNYNEKNKVDYSIFRQYLLHKKQLSHYYKLKATISLINKIKNIFRKK